MCDESGFIAGVVIGFLMLFIGLVILLAHVILYEKISGKAMYNGSDVQWATTQYASYCIIIGLIVSIIILAIPEKSCVDGNLNSAIWTCFISGCLSVCTLYYTTRNYPDPADIRLEEEIRRNRERKENNPFL